MNDSFGNQEKNAYAGGYGDTFGNSRSETPSHSDSETAQLLRELAETQRQCLEAQRKSLLTARLSLALCTVVLLAAALVVPAALRTMRRAEASLNTVTALARSVENAVGNAGEAAERINGTLSALDEEALDSLLSGGKLTDGIRNFQEGMTSFRTAMDKLNAIDFDALNQAVRDLSGMAAPFRQFAGLLGG